MIAHILIVALGNAVAIEPADAGGNGFDTHSVLEGSMTKTPGPNWSADQIAAGRRFADGWRKYAAGTEETQPITEEHTKIAGILARHETALMRYPHVVAVADGICRDEDGAAGTACIVVYVEKRVPPEELSEDQRLPEEIEGIRVEVVEAGQIGILPLE